MSEFTALAVSILLAYLVGAIPMGYFMAKIFKGSDIRKQGSGNVGATNVLRTVGKIPALITLIFDISKGAIVVLLIGGYAYQYLASIDQNFYKCLLGLVAIAGHIWPVFLKFKGGKGVATTIGVMAVISPAVLLLSLIVWVALFSLTSYVSVASIAFGVALPVFAAIMDQNFYIIIFSVIVCLLNTYKHSENIKRLSKGEESKTSLRKKS
jgi:glycerol-3-phosphate acyltransferase PlsY